MNTEESRAGGNPKSSEHRGIFDSAQRWESQVCSPIDGLPRRSDTGSPTVSAWWTAGGTNPPLPILYRASRCCFCHGDAGRRQQSRGYRCARFEQSARTHPSKICVHRLPFRILPRYVGGQAASEGRFGIRSVPTNSYYLIGRPVT